MKLNTLRLGLIYRHFADDMFKCIFDENVWISIKMSPKIVAKGPINDIPALVFDNGLVPTRWQVIILTNDG